MIDKQCHFCNIFQISKSFIHFKKRQINCNNFTIKSMSTNYKLKGNQAFKKGNYQEAIQYYQKYVENQNIDNHKAYSNISISCFRLKNYWKSIEACSEALLIDQKFCKCYYRRFMSRKQLIEIYQKQKIQGSQADTENVTDKDIPTLINGLLHDLKMFIKFGDANDITQITQMQTYWKEKMHYMYQPESIQRNKLTLYGMGILADIDEIEKHSIEGLGLSWMEYQGKQRSNKDRRAIMQQKIENTKKMALCNVIRNQKPIQTREQNKLWIQINENYNQLNEIAMSDKMTESQKEEEVLNINNLIKQLKERQNNEKKTNQLTDVQISTKEDNQNEKNSNSVNQNKQSHQECNQNKQGQKEQKQEKHLQIYKKQESKKQQVEFTKDQQKQDNKQENQKQKQQKKEPQIQNKQKSEQKDENLLLKEQLNSKTDLKQKKQSQSNIEQIENAYKQIFLKNYQSLFQKYHESFKAFTETIEIVLKSSISYEQKQRILGQQIPINFKQFKIILKGFSKKQKESLSNVMLQQNLGQLIPKYVNL